MATEEERPTPERIEAFKNVKRGLTALKEDEAFQHDLQRPEVIRALKHWANVERLPAEECEEWQHDYVIMRVFSRVRHLQHLCRTANMPLPLLHVLNGRDDIMVPKTREEEEHDRANQLDEWGLPPLPPAEPLDWRKVIKQNLVVFVAVVVAALWARYVLPDDELLDFSNVSRVADGLQSRDSPSQ
mmetsp:Transcript_59093/g.157264  ORF Transcript_59093/g.157264 Transcript_59093/m.157264 type:complete len:186 (-) Transcript_59093:113-670(-)